MGNIFNPEWVDDEDEQQLVPEGETTTGGKFTQKAIDAMNAGQEEQEFTPSLSQQQSAEQMPGYDQLTPVESAIYKALPAVTEKVEYVKGKMEKNWLGQAAIQGLTWAGKLLQVFDVGAEALERSCGLYAQWAAAADPDNEYTLEEFSHNLGLAWAAGSLFWDTTDMPQFSEYDAEGKGRVTLKWPELSDGTVFDVKQLIDSQRKIGELTAGGMKRSDAILQVKDEMYSEMGALAIRAQMSDLVGHVIFDPINFILPRLKPIERLHVRRANIMAKVPADTVVDLSRLDQYVMKLSGGLSQDISKWDKFNPFALTPEARSAEMLTNLSDRAGIYIISRADNDPGRIMKNFVALADGSVGPDFGHALTTLEGRQFQAALNLAKEDVTKAYGTYMMLAEEGVLDFINKADNLLADDLIFNIVAAIKKDELSDAILKRLADAGLEADPKIIALIKQFDSATPYTPELFGHRVNNLIKGAVGKQSISAFGLKQQGTLLKMTACLKSAETLAFLRANPGFAVRNFINNELTMIARGVGGFVTEGDITKLIGSLGFEPHRLSQAFSQAGISVLAESGVTDAADLGSKLIAGAIRGDPKGLSKYADKLNRWFKGIDMGPLDMGTLATRSELSASKRAFYKGYYSGWDMIWGPGKGFDNAFDALKGAGLSDDVLHKINDTLGSAMKEGDLDALRAGKILPKEILNDIERRANIKFSDIFESDEIEAIKDALAGSMDKGPFAVRQAIEDLKTKAVEAFEDLHVANKGVTGHFAEQYVAQGGVKGLAVSMGDTVDRIAHAHMAYYREMAELIPPDAQFARAFWDDQFKVSQNYWARVWDETEEAVDGWISGGTIKGKKSWVPRDIKKTFKAWRGDTESFFAGKNKRLKTFFDELADGKPHTLSWDDVKKLNSEGYAALTLSEQAHIEQMDDMICALLMKDPDMPTDMITNFTAWRKKSRDIMLEDRQYTQKFMDDLVGVPKEERATHFRKFYEKKMKSVTDIWENERAGLASFTGVDVPANHFETFKASFMPNEDAAVRMRELGRAHGIVNKADDPIFPYMTNIVNKYLRGEYTDNIAEGVQQFKRIEDIDPRLVEEALVARAWFNKSDTQKLDIVKKFIKDKGESLGDAGKISKLESLDDVPSDLAAMAAWDNIAGKAPVRVSVWDEADVPRVRSELETLFEDLPPKPLEVEPVVPAEPNWANMDIPQVARDPLTDLQKSLDDLALTDPEIAGKLSGELDDLMAGASPEMLASDTWWDTLAERLTETAEEMRAEVAARVDEAADIAKAQGIVDDFDTLPLPRKHARSTEASRKFSADWQRKLREGINAEDVLPEEVLSAREALARAEIWGKETVVAEGRAIDLFLEQNFPEVNVFPEVSKFTGNSIVFEIDDAMTSGWLQHATSINTPYGQFDKIGGGAFKGVFGSDDWDFVIKITDDNEAVREVMIMMRNIDSGLFPENILGAGRTSTGKHFSIMERVDIMTTMPDKAFIDKAHDLVGKGDIRKVNNWGVTKDGKTVLVDVLDWREWAKRDAISDIRDNVPGMYPSLHGGYKTGVDIIATYTEGAVKLQDLLDDPAKAIEAYRKYKASAGDRMAQFLRRGFMDDLTGQKVDAIFSWFGYKVDEVADINIPFRRQVKMTPERRAMFAKVRWQRKQARGGAGGAAEPVKLPPVNELTDSEIRDLFWDDPQLVNALPAEEVARVRPAAGVLDDTLPIDFDDLRARLGEVLMDEQDVEFYVALQRVINDPATEKAVLADAVQRLQEFERKLKQTELDKLSKIQAEIQAKPPSLPDTETLPPIQGPRPMRLDVPMVEGDSRLPVFRDTVELPKNTIPDPRWLDDGVRSTTPPWQSYEQYHMEKKMGLFSELQESANREYKPLIWDDLTPEQVQKIESYLTKTKGQMADSRYASIRFAEYKRDSALLNYNRRYNYNTWLGAIFPFEFWTTQSIMKWAVQSIDRPAMLSTYLKMKDFIGKAGAPNTGFPQRLRNHIRINIPFMPDWMGDDGMFVDPLRSLLPFDNWAAAFDPYQKDVSSRENLAERKIQELIRAGTVPSEDGLVAIETMEGPIWENAMALIDQTFEGEASPWDTMAALVAPHAPLDWAWKKMTGRQDEIGPFTPLGTDVQQIAGAFGVNAAKSEWGVWGNIREELGLHAYDKWDDDYRPSRMLANMAFTHDISTDQAIRAMIDKEGEIWDEAVSRAAKEFSGGSPIATVLKLLGIPTQSYPAGELGQRGLTDDFGRAYEAYLDGDATALRTFFDAHPEYEARLALWDTPEERMNQFLVDEMWSMYHEMPKVHKDQLKDMLGPMYLSLFLNGETRNTKNIPAETLQIWIKMMGGDPPGTLDSSAVPIEFAPSDVAWTAEQFYIIRSEAFPDYYDQQKEYFKLDKNARKQYLRENQSLKEYWDWRYSFLHKNPGVVEYVTDDYEFKYKSISDMRAAEEQQPQFSYAEWSIILGESTAQVLATGDIPEETLDYLTMMAERLGMTLEQMIYSVVNSQ